MNNPANTLYRYILLCEDMHYKNRLKTVKNKKDFDDENLLTWNGALSHIFPPIQIYVFYFARKQKRQTDRIGNKPSQSEMHFFNSAFHTNSQRDINLFPVQCTFRANCNLPECQSALHKYDSFNRNALLYITCNDTVNK